MAGSANEMQEMAGKVWRALNSLATNSPNEYKTFVRQAMEEGKEVLNPPEPVFCFSVGVRGREKTDLYINVCKWSRIPYPLSNEAPIPVKGGILRYVLIDGKRRKNQLLIDIAFNIKMLEECLEHDDLKQMLLSLSLDFIEDYLNIVTDRNLKMMSQKFYGPPNDIGYSLDEMWSDLMSKESRLDLTDSLLSSLKVGKRGKERKDNLNLPPLIPSQHKSNDKPRHSLVEDVTHLKTGGKYKSRTAPKYTVTVQEEGGRKGEGEDGEGEGRGREGGREGEGEEGEGGRRGRCVCVKVEMPTTSSVEEMDLDVSESDLSLQLKGYKALTIALPLAVDVDKTSAKFSKRSHTLSISIPSLCSH